MHANVGLVKTYMAAGTINEYRIVKWAANKDREAVQATAASEKFAGVAGLPKGTTAAAGEPFDVIKSGVADVTYGGTVAAGDFLTSDAQGRAVVASVGDFIIGVAQVAGVIGDLGGVQIQFGKC